MKISRDFFEKKISAKISQEQSARQARNLQKENDRVRAEAAVAAAERLWAEKKKKKEEAEKMNQNAIESAKEFEGQEREGDVRRKKEREEEKETEKEMSDQLAAPRKESDTSRREPAPEPTTELRTESRTESKDSAESEEISGRFNLPGAAGDITGGNADATSNIAGNTAENTAGNTAGDTKEDKKDSVNDWDKNDWAGVESFLVDQGGVTVRDGAIYIDVNETSELVVNLLKDAMGEAYDSNGKDVKDAMGESDTSGTKDANGNATSSVLKLE
jgi:hypothetical protein